MNPARAAGVDDRLHGVQFDGQKLFFAQVGMLGGTAPVRCFLPDLMDRVLTRKINPGKVFDLVLPLADVAEGIGRWTSGAPSRP
jgi:threonine dehydrogenase-like Zn-dependent dehydrogenase